MRGGRRRGVAEAAQASAAQAQAVAAVSCYYYIWKKISFIRGQHQTKWHSQLFLKAPTPATNEVVFTALPFQSELLSIFPTSSDKSQLDVKRSSESFMPSPKLTTTCKTCKISM
jgi:hypothetical protein